MNKRKLAIITSFMLIYSSFACVVDAEEANTTGDTALDEVIVTGSKPINPTKITVITEADIKAKGAQNVAEALKDVAGFYVTNSNVKGHSYGQFRGSDANSTKVIVDGVLLNSVGDGRADLAIIPTDNIEKIEVIKGAAPVMYGTDAPGGIIYITTKSGSKQPSTSITVAGGSWATERYSATLGGDAGKVNYYFGVQKENTDGYTSHDSKEAQYYNGKLKWDFNPKASLTVFGSLSDTTEQFPNRYNANNVMQRYPGSGGVISQQNSYFGGGGSGATYNWEYDPIKQSYIGAVYDQKLNNGSDISLKVYQSNQKSLLTTSSYQRVDWDGNVKGYELQHNFKTSKVNTATWGYSYETRDFVELTTNSSNNTTWNGTYNRADYTYTGKSYYLQDVLNVNSRLAASFGYRHNEDTDNITVHKPDGSNMTWAYNTPQGGTYTSDNPVFSLNYKLGHNTALHGSIGKSFRFPNAMERSAPGGYYLGTNTPDLYLLPESAINRELGLTHSLNSGLELDVTYYNKDITNMIKGQGQGSQRTQYENIPNVEMHGFEAEINQKFSKRIKAFVNYSYTNALDTRVHMQVSDIPYRKFSYGLNYAGKDGLTANLAVNYVGAVRSLFSEGNGNGSSDGNSNVNYNPVANSIAQTLPGYHVVDLKISKVIDKAEYYVKILNLLDEQYYTGVYLVAPGRYVEIGTTVRF